MKRKLSWILCLLILMIAIPIAAMAAPVGKITHLEGSADITVFAKTRVARMGDPVNNGEIIRTKRNSKVGVTFNDGNSIWIAEKSRLRITQYQPGEGQKSYVNLFRGKTRSIMGTLARKASFEVHTPTAVAGVRGTIFIGFFENGQSGFVFERGQGYGYNTSMPSKVVTIDAGQSMVVASKDQAPIVKPATATEIEKHVKDTSGTSPEDQQKKQQQGQQPADSPPPPPVEPPPPPPPPPQEPPPLPPPPPPEVPSGSSTTFTPMDVTVGGITGTLSGSINNQTNTGTLSLSGTGTALTGMSQITGTLSDGSTFEGILAGIPGTWSGLLSTLYHKGTGTGAGFLTGGLAGTYTPPNGVDGQVTASGYVYRSGIKGTISAVTPPSIPLPIFDAYIYLGGTSNNYFIYAPSSNQYIGGIRNSYETTTGGVIGTWGVANASTAYYNGPGISTWTNANYGYGTGSYYLLGDISGNDSVDVYNYHHLSLTGSLYYLDSQYMGLIGLDYRGNYNAGYGGYGGSIGAGTYELAPLAWNGTWDGTLYYNVLGVPTYGGSQECGLIGGLDPFWTGSSSFLAIGIVDYSAGAPPYLWNAAISGSRPNLGDDISANFSGYTAGIWKDGALRGYAMALYTYTDAENSSNNRAGWLTGNIFPDYSKYYSQIDKWKAEGTLTPTEIAEISGTANLGISDTVTITGNTVLAGTFSGGTGDIKASGYEWETRYLKSGSLPLPYGIYDIWLNGSPTPNTYVPLEGHPTTWTAMIGGKSTSSYFLADITSGQWTSDGSITAALNGIYLTDQEYGSLSGVLFGINTGGYWIAEALAAYDGHTLAFNGAASSKSSFGGWNASLKKIMFDTDSPSYLPLSQIVGLIGGTDSLFTGLVGNTYVSKSFIGMGIYNPATINGYPLFSAPITGDITPPTGMASGGEYQLQIGGIRLEDTFRGGARGLYTRATAFDAGNPTEWEAGILRSNLITGKLYADIGMWEIPDPASTSATLTATKKEGGIPSLPTFYYEPNAGSGNIKGAINGTGGVDGGLKFDRATVVYNSVERPYGILYGGFAGQYSTVPTAAWTAKAGGNLATGYWLADLSGPAWNADGSFTANWSGDYLSSNARVNWNDGTGIGVYAGGLAQGLMTTSYTQTDLAFGGEINYTGAFLYRSGDTFSYEGNMVGLMGGAVSPSIIPQPFLAMGTYSDMGHTMFRLPFSMHDNIENGDATVRFLGVKYGTDPSAYSLMARMLGIYLQFQSGISYEAGFVQSNDVTGAFYPGLGMWKAEGTISGEVKTPSFTSATPPVIDYDTVLSSGIIASLSGSGTGITAGRLGYITSAAGSLPTQPWGISLTAVDGTYVTGVASRMGGTLYTPTGTIAYWYRDVSAFTLAVDGTFTATISNGRNVGYFGSSTLSNGEMFGIYQSGGQTYQGFALGKYDTTPFLYANRIEGDLYKQNAATYHETRYEKPVEVVSSYNPMGTAEYQTGYIVSGNAPKYGMQSEELRNNYDQGNSRIYRTVYPSDTYIGYMNDNNVPRMWTTTRGSLFLSPWPDLSTSPPTTPYGVSPDTVLTNTWPVTSPITVETDEYAKTFKADYTDMNVMERILPPTPDEAEFDQTFKGIMGMYQLPGGVTSLWASNVTDPVGVTFLGAHQDTTLPFVFRLRRFYSQNYAVNVNNPSPTADGGAYIGFLSGTVSSDRSIDAMMYGLYMSPTVGGKWEAGFLKPTATLTGTDYAGVNMWEADGTMYRVPYYTDLTSPYVDALHLLDLAGTPSSWVNLVVGGMGYSGKKTELYGQFKSGSTLSGYIKSLVSMGYGTTLSIKDLSCFGIFEILHGGINNIYSNPSGYTSWRMDMASTGQFGGNTVSYGTYNDFGLWMASIDGALSSPNKLSGTLTGEFLTYRKQGLPGSLTGTFLGNLMPETGTAGSWQGVTVGAWEKTRDVNFSSGITGQSYTLKKAFYGGVDASSNYWANERLDGSDRSASSYTNLAGPTITYTKYNWSGPPSQYVYSKTVWNMTNPSEPTYTLQEASELTAAAYDSEINALIAAMPNKTEGYNIDWGSGHDGVFAGFGDLWNNLSLSQSDPYNPHKTELALMGQYGGDIGVKPALFGGTIASFNPLVDMNPYVNSQSPIGGAYYGYLGATFGKNVVTADWLDGLVNGIYFDATGSKVGVFTGAFTGDNNPNIAAWSGTGTIDYGYQLSQGYGGLNAFNFVSNLQFENWNNTFGATDGVVEGADVKLRTEQTNVVYVSNGHLFPVTDFWTVWQSIAGGTYSGTPTAWQSEYNKNTSHGQSTDYGAFQTTGTVKGITTGTYVGASVQYGVPFTDVRGGSFKGLFDPATATFQAIAQGVSMATSTFLAKAAAISGNAAAQEAFMNATKIPVVQVGQATLSQGVGTVNNLSNVTMSNVTFFSNATGGVPSIWATSGVGGNYTGTPSTSGPSVNLSGNGLGATFNVNYWDGTNKNWGAKVAGSGTLSGGLGQYNGTVNFKGGAAGKIDLPATGSFSGTGAGIAKQ